nr:LINE-type retrotransposon LIb DNA [Ipomoea batatas]
MNRLKPEKGIERNESTTKEAETEVVETGVDGETPVEPAAVNQTPTPKPTSTLQEKRPYGTWMLVTKKAKPVEYGRNSRQPRKEANVASVSRGNQYDVLADLQEHSEPIANRNRTEKGKSKHTQKQGLKVKAPTASTHPPALRNSVTTPLPVVNSGQSEGSHLPNRNNRGRGNRGGGSRGRGRGDGRGRSVGALDSNGLGSPPAVWNGRESPPSIFQFGAPHAANGTTPGLCKSFQVAIIMSFTPNSMLTASQMLK